MNTSARRSMPIASSCRNEAKPNESPADIRLHDVAREEGDQRKWRERLLALFACSLTPFVQLLCSVLHESIWFAAYGLTHFLASVRFRAVVPLSVLVSVVESAGTPEPHAQKHRRVVLRVNIFIDTYKTPTSGTRTFVQTPARKSRQVFASALIGSSWRFGARTSLKDTMRDLDRRSGRRGGPINWRCSGPRFDQRPNGVVLF